MKLNYGTPWLNANSLLKIKTTMIGSPAFVIHHYTKLALNLNLSNPISPLLDGTEDSKFGALTLKLDTLSRLTKVKLTLFLFHLTPNI